MFIHLIQYICTTYYDIRHGIHNKNIIILLVEYCCRHHATDLSSSSNRYLGSVSISLVTICIPRTNRACRNGLSTDDFSTQLLWIFCEIERANV